MPLLSLAHPSREQDGSDGRTCGSLFSGVGLLDYGLHLAGWEHRWLCEVDEWRRSVLRKRFPGAVIYDDIRTLRGEVVANPGGERRQQIARGPHGDEASDAGRRAAHDHEPASARQGWLQAAERVTLIAGGFPCKGASTAGKRTGLGHPETALWGEMRRVIREVRPRYVLVENVANIRSMAAYAGQPKGSLWGTVLGDLAALGYGHIVWDCIPAAAIGAPHLRDRVFAVARYTDCEGLEGRGVRGGRTAASGGVAVDAPYARGVGRERRSRRSGERGPAPEWGKAGGDASYGRSPSAGVAVEWGDYEPAIRRWEAIHGPAPEPLVRRLDDGDAKLRRLRARVDRSRLSALGDGVHVYVGWIVGELIMRELGSVATCLS